MKQRNECDNYNKSNFSRPQILEVILNEYQQKPISFLELLGDGTGAEFYSTWLNIKELILIERDRQKYESYDLKWAYEAGLYADLWNIDLNKYFQETLFLDELDVINLDFCTFLYDNGKENCTASIINSMFKHKAIRDNGLVFFTFMITGMGANFSKQAIKDRDDIFKAIKDIALRNGYEISEELYYTYKSSISTRMANLGIKVNKI